MVQNEALRSSVLKAPMVHNGNLRGVSAALTPTP